MRTTYSIQGERWDQLCYRVYGMVTEDAVMQLRHANRAVTSGNAPFLLPAGALLNVPEIAIEMLTVDVVEVAPWQR
ncbi:MAG: tail protein X [Kluyvera sp.]|uniref:tail protein X n=1 Tax=Kluyvera sp. TaxID=1538228 RepID=UPI003A882BE5